MQSYLTGIPRKQPTTLFVELPRKSDPRFFIIEPEFALGDTVFPGDFQIALDDAPFLNLTNVPYSGFIPPERPSRRIEVELEAAETDGAFVKIQALDNGYLMDEDGNILTDESDVALVMEAAEPEWWGDQSWSLLTEQASYQAKTTVLDDDGSSADRYVAVWFKNGEPITAGITNPKIQVIQVADGADLVAEIDMAEIASTGTYRYVETSSRIVNGVAYLIKITATIAGATRTWYQPTGRDNAE